MKRLLLGVFLSAVLIVPTTVSAQSWPQWAQNPQHTGTIDVVGQNLGRKLADIVYDPFVPQEQIFSGENALLTHYQVPLLEGQDVFMAFKTGSYPLDQPDPTQFEVFHQKRLHWEAGRLVEKWDFQTDWKPLPLDFVGGWEPVYHALLANGHVYDVGLGGTLFKLNRGNGTVVAHINPFGGVIDRNTFVSGPPSADSNGNIYYNVIRLDVTETTIGSWLVKVAPDNSTSKVSYATLIPDAPATCIGRFPNSALPWPPSPTATPSFMFPCGIARAGVNVAPAIAPDGTIYTVGRVDNSPRYGWVIAVNPNLTRKWDTSMRNLFKDGCGVLIPIATSPTPTKGTCRFGAVTDVNFGFDPTTNRPGDGNVLDQSSSSPTVLPDGNVLYGSYTRYNIARGHLIKFNGATGAVMAFFDFGWDTTPAVFSHDGTYSIVIKDNHYDEEAGFYCNPSPGCAINPNLNVSCKVCDFDQFHPGGEPAGPFYITQLNSNLVPEWKAHSTETQSCTLNLDGTLSCVTDHHHGFEWCINAPVIDANNTVYVESEDGNLYKIPQGQTGVFDLPPTGSVGTRLFLRLALGAAYTPFSIDREGRLYAQNGGHLFVVGE